MRNTMSGARPILRTLRAVLASLTLGVGLMLVPAAFALAQDNPVPVVAAVEPDYTIGIDDVIFISSPSHTMEVNQEVLVLPDGTIRVNGVPEKIKAAGRTLEEVRTDVFKGLDRYYNNLEVSVSLKAVNSRMVTILGSRSPGRVPLRKDMRVSGLIAAGGGLVGKTKVVVGTLQRDFKQIKLDMPKIVGVEPEVEADLLLQPNDTVVLDYKEEPPAPMFSVLGAVVKGGTFNMPLDGTPVSLARAVADAGGRTDKASLAKVKLLRKNTTMELNLLPLLVEGKADAAEGQILMHDGDVLIIPELDAKYMVLGQVNRPSAVYIPEARTVTVLQALADGGGGPNQNADMRAAGIMRLTEDGKKQFIKINLEDLLKKPEKSLDYVMQDKDVLYIPPKKKGLTIQDITNPLWVLSLFGLRVF